MDLTVLLTEDPEISAIIAAYKDLDSKVSSVNRAEFYEELSEGNIEEAAELSEYSEDYLRAFNNAANLVEELAKSRYGEEYSPEKIPA